MKNILHESDLHSVEQSWGTNDHDGHGTAIAGIATYFDLVDCLVSDTLVEIGHEIESVKILPPRNKPTTKAELFGAVTEQAVYQAEIERPNAKRIICMAVTADKYNTDNGSPTSWSAALDNLISGATDHNKRLFFVSAGNVNPIEFSDISYPEANILHPVESPGQSWNAITVGAYSKKATLENPDLAGYSAVADALGLSPFSSTSLKWDKKWPNKPDILCDGGNLARSKDFYTQSDELSLLSTEAAFHTHLFTTIHGTSSAVAQASWIAAQILEKYPQFWPETVRALMIDSAEWSSDMLDKFCKSDRKIDKRTLLRTCGYGIPNIETALWTSNNSVSMIIQSELQPFTKDKDRYKTKEMHIHNLPWPKDVLKELGALQVTMRVTLSYYIEPGPGEIGWKDRYRYASCGLRFDVNNTNETIEDFKKRINIAVRDDEKDSGEGDSGSSRWFLGKTLRDVGSLHSDIWQGNAIDLCECNYIGIYPTIGWWRERAYLGRYNRKVRYALVVSLRTPPQTVDLYTPIMTEIKNRVSVPIEVSIKNGL